MKKHLLLASAALMIAVLPLSSFKSSDLPAKNQAIANPKHLYKSELGEFTVAGQTYAVYGDNITGVLTAVDFFPSGTPVHSWSGFYRTADKHAVVTIYPYNSTDHFSYDGTLEFY